jgi:hypothetical protein
VAWGWGFLAANDHLVIRTALGYTQTLAADASADLPAHPELQQRLEPRFDAEADELLSKDVKLPIISATLGYRF